MHEDDIEFSDEGIREVDKLVREATRIVCGTNEFPIGLARFIESFPTLAPRMVAATSIDPGAQRALCSVVFREIWNRAPRPDNNFRPRPLPRQERNNPCQCGSGRKYKHCCAQLDQAIPFDVEGLSLLKYVLEDIPQAQFEKLPFRHMSAEELAFVSSQWFYEGRADAVTALLVPLLADVEALDARHEAAFDVLCDAYLGLGMPEARDELVQRMMQATDTTLKSAALHRRCTMLTDAGQWPEAWKIFAEAQRLQPDNPALSHLEVIMLASEGRLERAQERARFWLARLARQGIDQADDPAMDFLRLMSQNPEEALAVMRGEGGDEEDEEDEEDWEDDAGEVSESMLVLIGMLETLPEPECHYKLQSGGGDAGGLKADSKLMALERQWRDVFDSAAMDELDEIDPFEDTEWVDWLADHPLAWQSFRVLEDVAMVIDDMLIPDGSEELLDRLETRHLARAVSLLEIVVARNRAQGCRLEWGWLQNRPALRLVARHIGGLEDQNESCACSSWLVGTLNPNDNQGLRESLVHELIGCDRAADALAVSDRYSGDSLGAMMYGRVLALQQLGRIDEALASLATARKEYPKILTTLIAARPRAPKLEFDQMRVGGDDEAWYYRMDWRPVWQSSGALNWLKKAAARSG